MKYSTLDYLRVIESRLPAGLVSPASLERIRALAAELPLSSNFGFECRLSDGKADADFLVAVVPSDGSLAAWADQNTSSRLHEELGARGSWSLVREVLKEWHSGGMSLAPVHDAWLEFDIDPTGAALPDPSFFFGFDDTTDLNHPVLSEDLVDRLLRFRLSEDRRQRLRTCFSALPAPAVIFQVGVMLPRATEEVRLCLRGLAPAAMPGYLERIGWPGSIDSLRAHIDLLVRHTDAIGLDFSLRDGIGPEIGFELEIKSGAPGRQKLQRCLQALGELGLCREEKGDAILSWLGYSTEDGDPERWPQHLRKASEALGPEVISTFLRNLNHIKVGFLGDRFTGAKAYLGVRHFWGTRRREVVA